jgi:uncharacterized protein Usg
MSDSKTFYRQLQGYSLATAAILYRMPDHPAILQTFVWQDYDLAPHFPELRRFLDFWTHFIDAPLHTVTVAHTALFNTAEIISCNGEWRLH